MSKFSIVEVDNKHDLSDTATLFEAYARSLGIDLGFQGFAAEMADMPGKYAKPRGALLLARTLDGAAIGCVGLRPLNEDICEMKRLYVAPGGRGTGLGRALAEAVISAARQAGYQKMRLDTLSSMTSALSLYKSLGFYEIIAYYVTPLAETVFLELKL